MPSVSEKQRRFMGVVRGIQKGNIPAQNASPQAAAAAESMSPRSVKDFASQVKALKKGIKK